MGRRQPRDEPVQSSVPQSQSQGIRISGSSTLAEFLQHIFELIHTFNTTGDIDYLEDSILLCEEMIAANYDHEHIKLVRALFDGLLGRRTQVVTVGPRAEPIEVLPCNSGVLTDPETVPASEPAGTVNSTASETMTQIRAPVTRFDPTRVINPPEAAIRLTVRITASPDSPVVIIQERLVCPTMQPAQPSKVGANDTASQRAQHIPQILLYCSQAGHTVDELLEGIKTLMALNDRTDEFEYLEAVIELIEEIISGNAPRELRTVLKRLHAYLSAWRPISTASEPEIEIPDQSDIILVYLNSYQYYAIPFYELVDVLVDMYDVTGDFYYLEKVIGLIEVVIGIVEDSEDSEASEYAVELQECISYLAGMRVVATTSQPPAQITAVIEQPTVVLDHVLTLVVKFIKTGEISQISEAILITEWIRPHQAPSAGSY